MRRLWACFREYPLETEAGNPFEVAHVARDHLQVMVQSRRCDLEVGIVDRPSFSREPGLDLAVNPCKARPEFRQFDLPRASRLRKAQS